MISALLLILTVLISLTIVRIGAIAFEMTGMDRDQARFQALSCFSGTGFTTREAEQVVGQFHRRRIASFLMILGNAGIVTVITALVVSASQDQTSLSLRNVGLIAIGVVLALLLFRSPRFLNWLGNRIRSSLSRRTDIGDTDVTEVLRQAEGYCISRLRVVPESPLAGKTVAGSGLRARDILVLSIERGGALIPLPTAERVIQPKDDLICYGPIRSIRGLSHPRPRSEPDPAGETT